MAFLAIVATVAIVLDGAAGLAAALLGSLTYLGAVQLSRLLQQRALAQATARAKVRLAIVAALLRPVVFTALFAAFLLLHQAKYEGGAAWMLGGLVAMAGASVVATGRQWLRGGLA